MFPYQRSGSIIADEKYCKHLFPDMKSGQKGKCISAYMEAVYMDHCMTTGLLLSRRAGQSPCSKNPP